MIQRGSDVKKENIRTLRNNFCLLRKTFENPKMLYETNYLVQRILDETCQLTSEGIEKGIELYWARELSSFYVYCKEKGIPYHEYLPGRFYTYWRLLKKITNVTNVAGRRIIELGCGSGICSILLSKEGAIVTGFDRSAVAVRFFKELAQYHNVEVTAKTGNFFNSGFADDEFEIAFNLGVFEHLNNKEQRKLLSEMNRISSDLIIVSIPNQQSPIFKTMAKTERNNLSDEYFNPLEAKYHNVYLVDSFRELQIEIVDIGALHIIPPPTLPSSFLTYESYRFFNSLLKRSKEELINEKDRLQLIKKWSDIEDNIPEDMILKYGWFVYVIGKTKK